MYLYTNLIPNYRPPYCLAEIRIFSDIGVNAINIPWQSINATAGVQHFEILHYYFVPRGELQTMMHVKIDSMAQALTNYVT